LTATRLSTHNSQMTVRSSHTLKLMVVIDSKIQIPSIIISRFIFKRIIESHENIKNDVFFVIRFSAQSMISFSIM